MWRRRESTSLSAISVVGRVISGTAAILSGLICAVYLFYGYFASVRKPGFVFAVCLVTFGIYRLFSIRRSVSKWIGLTISMGVGFVLFVAFWVGGGFPNNPSDIYALYGTLFIAESTMTGRLTTGMGMFWPVADSGGTIGLTLIPLWMPLFVFAIPTLVVWLQDRGYPPGFCQCCGYDLTGNESGRCSECGKSI